MEGSRGLREQSERYPRLIGTAIFLVRLRRAGIRGISFTGGIALRAYPRLPSLHPSGVPALLSLTSKRAGDSIAGSFSMPRVL
jgi:hypothetical protein